MGRQDKRRPLFGIQGKQKIRDPLSVPGIQMTRGLVSKEDPGAASKRPRQGHALLLPPGEGGGPVVKPPLEPDRRKRRPRPFRRVRKPAQPEREEDVFQRRETGQQMESLEHETDRLEPQVRPFVIREGTEIAAHEADRAGLG